MTSSDACRAMCSSMSTRRHPSISMSTGNGSTYSGPASVTVVPAVRLASDEHSVAGGSEKNVGPGLSWMIVPSGSVV